MSARRRNLVLSFLILISLVYLWVRRSPGKMEMKFAIEHRWNSALIDDHRPITVTLSSSEEKDQLSVTIDAPFFNDPAPPSTGSTPGPYPELWNFEVVELFFLSSSSGHYLELEFSPQGHYLVLLLTARRQIFQQMLPVSDFQVERPSADRWIGRARIPRSLFPARVDRFNAFAIHGLADTRTYEALYPGPAQRAAPDFHRLEDFQGLPFESFVDVGANDGDYWQKK